MTLEHGVHVLCMRLKSLHLSTVQYQHGCWGEVGPLPEPPLAHLLSGALAGIPLAFRV